MNIIIIGEGKVGFALTEQLSSEGHDIVVIDNRQAALRNSADMQDVRTLQGNGATADVLLDAGVEKADLVIAVTGTDEMNVMCCMMAKRLGARHTIARVRNPEYAKQMYLINDMLGLSMSVNPESSAAREISRLIRFPSATKIDTFVRGRVEIIELPINKDCPMVNLSLYEIYRKWQIKVLVCAVERENAVYIPNGAFVLRAGDRINLTGTAENISNFLRALGMLTKRGRDVMLVGGSRIAYYLAGYLENAGMSVKIIEQDEKRCMELAEKLPEAEIICGDGTDQELLDEEGMEEADAFVALTGIDEENIILSMYAKKRGAKKVIAKVDRLSFLEVLGEGTGIESVISPKAIATAQIVRYVRAMEQSVGSSMESLSSIVGGKAEAIEFRIGKNAKFTGVPLKQLRLKENLLIAAVVRKDVPIIPNGDTKMEIGDSVIVVTTLKKLHSINDIFSVGAL
ncbi:MAG: Trk system potassium transporter TrkA [Clostridia bacterium]|nr:Trk system potassium transporter TrkA [Clostridia bacterium]